MNVFLKYSLQIRSELMHFDRLGPCIFLEMVILKLALALFLLCGVSYSYHYSYHYSYRALPTTGHSAIRPSRGMNFGGCPPLDRSHGLFMADSVDNETSKGTPVAPQDNLLSNNIFARRWNGLSAETRGEIETSAVTFAIALLVRILVVEPRFIPSLSMFPTFDIGDQLLVDKITHFRKPYQKRDVVVFNPSDVYKEMTGNNEALIKRIVATAGDIVEVKDNRLLVNGIEQQENYVNDYPDYTLPPTKVPAGMLLVLGDNRNHSFDSHVWGFLPEKNVIGRAFVKYWPPWRAGVVEGSY